VARKTKTAEFKDAAAIDGRASLILQVDDAASKTDQALEQERHVMN
jgi:hypothetical protein